MVDRYLSALDRAMAAGGQTLSVGGRDALRRYAKTPGKIRWTNRSWRTHLQSNNRSFRQRIFPTLVRRVFAASRARAFLRRKHDFPEFLGGEDMTLWGRTVRTSVARLRARADQPKF